MDQANKIYNVRDFDPKSTNATTGIKWEDIFIEAEASVIKFCESPLFSICTDR